MTMKSLSNCPGLIPEQAVSMETMSLARFRQIHIYRSRLVQDSYTKFPPNIPHTNLCALGRESCLRSKRQSNVDVYPCRRCI